MTTPTRPTPEERYARIQADADKFKGAYPAEVRISVWMRKP